MSTLTSSVLLVEHPQPENVTFGSDFTNLSDALSNIENGQYSVVALPIIEKKIDELSQLLSGIQRKDPDTLNILVYDGAPSEKIIQLMALGEVYRLVESYHSEDFEKAVQESLEQYNLKKQNEQMLKLVQEQNERLTKLSQDLESRVSKRQKSLRQSQQRLLETNQRVIALHNTLLVVYRSKSITEMENQVTEALNTVLDLSWIKIVFSQAQEQSLNRINSQQFSTLRVPLFKSNDHIGAIYFARKPQQPFLKDETNFLKQVAEGVSLAIDRTSKLQQSETLKQQWETTFDAISSPVSLITEDYIVSRANKAFADRSHQEIGKILGKKCYAVLFDRKDVCRNCKLGKSFKLKALDKDEGVQQIYRVQSQSLPFRFADKKVFFNIYSDQSEQLRLEQQVLESAKLAELGTIGSSIAHELNNPLGGMLNFIQLIKMDLDGSEDFYADIEEMEKGAEKCKEIIQNLLGFTRRADLNEYKENDVREIVEQALKITEIQTRALGIKTFTEEPKDAVLFKVQFNLLSQAIRNILQNAQEAIIERKSIDTSFEGVISVSISETARGIFISISDNGIPLAPDSVDQIFNPLFTTKGESHTGIGLSITQQIIESLGGRIEVETKDDEKIFLVILPKA